MALTKEKKGEILKKLKDIFGNSESAVFVNFSGLSAFDTVDMRNALREESVGYFVAKKTLMKRVLKESGFKGEIPMLSGETAVAYPLRQSFSEASEARPWGGPQQTHSENNHSFWVVTFCLT